MANPKHYQHNYHQKLAQHYAKQHKQSVKKSRINIGSLFLIIFGIVAVIISLYLNHKNNNTNMILFVFAGIFFMFYGLIKLKK